MRIDNPKIDTNFSRQVIMIKLKPVQRIFESDIGRKPLR